MYPALRVYVDFDGTISRRDTTDELLERFADPAWRKIEEAWVKGELGSRECMTSQVALLRASLGDLDAALLATELDPGFPAFVEQCRKLKIPVTILSDGFDRAISAALGRYDLDLPVLANRLEWRGDGRWSLSFPNAQKSCASGSGHCKCESMSSPRGINILIGDGRSDFCAAEKADMVFAKASLLKHCRTNGIAHIAFDNFAELKPVFLAWIGRLREQLDTDVTLTSLGGIDAAE